MKLSERRPNTAVTFIDSGSGEVILRAAADARSKLKWDYRLYDSNGRLTACSEPSHYPEGLEVKSADGELLLLIPAELGLSVQYRLYNKAGFLMTRSDGERTEIFGYLRMESQ